MLGDISDELDFFEHILFFVKNEKLTVIVYDFCLNYSYILFWVI